MAKRKVINRNILYQPLAQPYTIEELNARIDCAEADIAEGRIISREEASERMQSYMNKYL